DNYNIPKMTPEVKKAMSKGSPCIAFCRLPDQNTAKEDSPYTDEYALVVAVHNEQTIYVFYSKTIEQKDNLVDMFFEKYFLTFNQSNH
ncbi:MAG: hypothetical protein K5867_09175, partial [Bacteroidales bacterium]|nr:hypothetical protein [Bacteroidales bacterium]